MFWFLTAFCIRGNKIPSHNIFYFTLAERLGIRMRYKTLMHPLVPGKVLRYFN